MSKSSVMSFRVPEEVRQGLVRLAARFGHKPAQVGARLLEEGLRRREFPLIELRDTAGGRVSYLRGSRLTVYWVVQSIRSGLSARQFTRDFGVTGAQVQAALAYAARFPEEMTAAADLEAANRRWLAAQDLAGRVGGSEASAAKPAAGRKARR